MISGQQIANDINNAFAGQEYEQEKQTLAQHVMAIGMDWCNNQPKSFNSGSLSRGEVRKQRRENRKALSKYITEQLEKDKKAAEELHSVEFLGIMTTILYYIISGVVSWVVSKLLNEYYG